VTAAYLDSQYFWGASDQPASYQDLGSGAICIKEDQQ